MIFTNWLKEGENQGGIGLHQSHLFPTLLRFSTLEKCHASISFMAESEPKEIPHISCFLKTIRGGMDATPPEIFMEDKK